MSRINETIGNVMRTSRALTDMSLREYAKYLGISPATLSRIEHDKGCDLKTLDTIHRVTKISYQILMAGVKP